MRRLFAIMIPAMIFCTNFIVPATGAPNGFVVWSEGSGCERVLKFNKLENGILGPKQTAIKMDSGVDIGVKISFDGKWITFGRTIGFFGGRYGQCDCMAFGKFDIYIARIDGALPAKPIKIGHGYWPSWSDDSFKETKTLYYNVFEEKAYYKTTIKPDGSFSTPIKHADWPPKNAGTTNGATMEISPNGRYIAYRPSLRFSIWDIKEKHYVVDNFDGYFPSWGPRSKYLIWRSDFVCEIENGKAKLLGDPKINGRAGLSGYWPTFSNDAEYDNEKLWIIGMDTGFRNRAYPIVFKEIDISDGQWKVGESTQVGQGTSADIHIFSERTSITLPRTNLFAPKSEFLTIQIGPNTSGITVILPPHDLYGDKTGLFDILGKKKMISPKSLHLPD